MIYFALTCCVAIGAPGGKARASSTIATGSAYMLDLTGRYLESKHAIGVLRHAEFKVDDKFVRVQPRHVTHFNTAERLSVLHCTCTIGL